MNRQDYHTKVVPHNSWKWCAQCGYSDTGPTNCCPPDPWRACAGGFQLRETPHVFRPEFGALRAFVGLKLRSGEHAAAAARGKLAALSRQLPAGVVCEIMLFLFGDAGNLPRFRLLKFVYGRTHTY